MTPISRRELLRNAALGVAAMPLANELLRTPGAEAAEATDVDVWEGRYLGQSNGLLEFDIGAPQTIKALSAPASMYWSGASGRSAPLVVGDRTLVRTTGGVIDSAWSNLSVLKGRVQKP